MFCILFNFQTRSSGNEHKHNADIEKNAERENTY